LTSHVQHGHRRRLAAPTEWHVKWVQRGVRARLCRTAALAGCGGGSGEDASAPAAPVSVERQIAPADTDAAIDAAAAPWSGGHSLLTSAPPNPNPTGITLAPTHGAPVADAPTPRAADGTPLYSEVWSVLCFP
jgi:hypothetical protein